MSCRAHNRREEDLAELQARIKELEAKIAAMPEPVVIDEAVAERVMKTFCSLRTPTMLATLREVLGERVVVSGDSELRAENERMARDLDKHAECLDGCMRDRDGLLKHRDGLVAESEELRAENERLKARVGELELIEANLWGMQARYCIEGDYCEDGVHPVEVRIQTQQSVIAELQKKLADSEAARKEAEAERGRVVNDMYRILRDAKRRAADSAKCSAEATVYARAAMDQRGFGAKDIRHDWGRSMPTSKPTKLSKTKVGVRVDCAVCGQQKRPRGRDSMSHYCDWDCTGYTQPPFVGSLWPGESEADFGFPVGSVGTEEKS